MAPKSLILLCLILIVFYSDASMIKTFLRQRRSTNVCATAESWNRLTNTDPGKRCIFPFEYKGVTYNACTDVDSEKVSSTKFLWCATEVNQDGKILEDSWNWGECNSYCTKSGSLMVSSTGAAKDVCDTCLGTYELTGQISNSRVVYKHQNNERYLHFSNNSNWKISRGDFGSGWVYSHGGGETPHEADQSKWFVYIRDDNPVRHKYTHDGGDWYKDPTFRVVAIS